MTIVLMDHVLGAAPDTYAEVTFPAVAAPTMQERLARYEVVADRVPTVEELRQVEKDRRMLVNIYDRTSLASVGLTEDATLERVQA